MPVGAQALRGPVQPLGADDHGRPADARRAGPARRGGGRLRQRDAADRALPEGFRLEPEGGRAVTAPAARLAQAEVVDAGGQGVRLIDVHAWPLAIGRALDNDIVLPDPHVAAHHATLAPGDDGRLRLQVGESRNGVRIEHGRTRAQLRAGEQAALPALARV
ncbi:MAG: FHA domain-containing protein, partial [Burkholderiaceae bacterium]